MKSFGEIMNTEVDSLRPYGNGKRSGQLTHYASKYYDPVKAHEYYMRTRQLKGRKKGKKLTEKQRTAIKVVKENIREERKSRITAHRDTMNAEIKKLRVFMKAYLDDKKEELSPREKKEIRENVKQEISKLRAKFREFREKLKDEYASTTEREIDNIRSNYH